MNAKAIAKILGMVVVSGLLSLVGQNIMDSAVEEAKVTFHGKIPMVAAPIENKEKENEEN